MTWESPLSGRYASPPMQALWSERRRIGLWRRLWLALMESERELGLVIPPEAVSEVRDHLDDLLADERRGAADGHDASSSVSARSRMARTFDLARCKSTR